MNEEILVYYGIVILGVLFVTIPTVSFILMYRKKEYKHIGKSILSFIMGILILILTLPSLKNMIFKEYTVIAGKCIIEESDRKLYADITMLDTNEIHTFREFPYGIEYGKNIPYYCELTTTKDEMVDISYKVYTLETRELIYSSK